MTAFEPLARAANLSFIPFGEHDFPAERIAGIVQKLSSMKGEEGLQFTFDAIALVTEAKWRTLPKLLAATGVDAVVIDECDFYSATIPRHLGIPFATLSNAVHFDFSGYTPLCVYDWPHQVTPEGTKRNRQGAAKFTQMLMRSNAGFIAQAERAGIKANWKEPSSLHSDRLWISQCPQEFDFESSHWPQQFHYTGPFHDGKGRMDFPFPWDRLTGEPVVYASMGTLQNGNADVFRTIVSAISKHKDLQLVLSIGNVLDPEQIGPVPKNAIVVNNAPQLELLKKASVCVTHAGFNTVLEALTQGVPQIAIPVTNDQFGIAARIADKKTGTVASLEGLDSSRLSDHFDEVLNNPVYRHNARSMQKAIARKNGLSVAADLLEEAFGVTKKLEGVLQKTF